MGKKTHFTSQYRVIQVLPPERKHPLLIDLNFSKNPGMIVYRYTRRTFCKNLNFFIRNRIVICTFLTLFEGGKLTISSYLFFPLLVSNRPLSALL
jgi:hypothetical protein